MANHEYSYLRWQLIILGLFRFSEALAWTAIFPYIFIMMQSFLAKGPKRDAQAATYASLTIALFTLGEFLMGIGWAKISDSLGRKPTLMIGVFGASLSAMAFGFSKNIWMALGARLFGGLVNPNTAVVSACVGEIIKRKEHQGKGFSVVPFLRGLGSLIGPVIGGHLSDPVKNLPSIFNKGTLWETFPYLLPNIVVVLFIVTTGLLGFLFLDESHPQKHDRTDVGRMLSGCITRNIASLFGISSKRQYTTLSTEDNTVPMESMDQRANEESIAKYSNTPSPTLSTSPNSEGLKTSAYTKKVILQILVVSLLALHKVSSDVIIPTFLATPTARDYAGVTFKFKAGFGLGTPNIANVLFTQAIIAILSQVFIVPKVVDRFGPLKTIRWGSFVFPWLYYMTPFTARLPYPLSITALLLDLWTKGVLVNLGYVSSAILLTNTTPAPEYLATVNGAAASISCLARSIGAAVSGSLFHAGLISGYIGLPFWVLGIVATVGALVSLFLDDKP